MSYQFTARSGKEYFSPLLVAGLMIRPLPTGPLDHLLRYISRRIQHNHPAILERLRPLAGTRFLICPTDLPHDIDLIIGEDHVDCRLSVKTPTSTADVIISGSFRSLVEMMDGKQDGDGLFFARRLVVTGDTEALLTLRNAIDSDDIDLEQEILALFGPLKSPASLLARRGARFYRRLARDMTILNQAITGPLSDRCDDLEQENQQIKYRLGQLDRTLTKTRSRLQSLGRKNAL